MITDYLLHYQGNLRSLYQNYIYILLIVTKLGLVASVPKASPERGNEKKRILACLTNLLLYYLIVFRNELESIFMHIKSVTLQSEKYPCLHAHSCQ